MRRLEKIISGDRAMVPSRRGFLKMVGGTAGVGLTIGFLPAGVQANEQAVVQFFTPFIQLTPNGRVVVLIKHLDKGQGVATGLATLVAEELDAMPDQIDVEFAPADTEKYKNLLWGVQGTGGSTSLANSFDQYRQAGAAVRAVLVKAAAKKWGVTESSIQINAGQVISGRKTANFSELLPLAAKEKLPSEVTLKKPSEWKFIGKHFPRVDSAMKSTGASGAYAMDFQPEGHVVAVLERLPRWGAKIIHVNDAPARAVKGVLDVIEVPQGVAVIAENTWAAIKGKRILEISWDFSDADNRGSEQLFREYKDIARQQGHKAETRGMVVDAFESAATVKEFEFEFPYLAHAAMEPLDVTIQFDGATAKIWTGSQIPTLDQAIAAATLGIDPSAVTVQPQWAGGSFGRRAIYDSHFVAEAAAVAKAWNKPRPIKIVWTREDDMRGGYYRPMYVHRARLGFDDKGSLQAWQHHIVGQPIFKGTPLEPFFTHQETDLSLAEGILHTTYDVANFDLEITEAKVGVPVLWWRSVGHTHTAYAVETMMDVAAKEAGVDPVAYRQNLMKDDARKRAVLDLVVSKAGWSNELPNGRFRGVAVHESFGAYVAQVAEISLVDGEVKVEKVWCAVDCGLPVNPDNIKAQIEGGIGFGLSAILRNEITLTNGEVDQSNFHDYNPLRIEEMPDIEVHIMPSEAPPSGIGEPGVPPIGPAVANAIFAATGDMPTKLPLAKLGLSS